MDPTALNSGDTAWMLTSTALVMLMTVPGVALYYGGLVEKRKRFKHPIHVTHSICNYKCYMGNICIPTSIWNRCGGFNW